MVCEELMPIHLLSDSSIEKQVALLKALYGKHPYKYLYFTIMNGHIRKYFKLEQGLAIKSN